MNYKRLLSLSSLVILAACSPTISSTAEENTQPPAEELTAASDPIAEIPSESDDTQLVEDTSDVDASVGLVTTPIDSDSDAYETTPDDLIGAIGSYCDPMSILYYRSEILSAPNGKIKAYATGLMTKTVSEERAARGREEGYCFGDVQTTTNRQVVFQRDNRADRTQKDDYADGFVVFQPRSFSGGSSYLIGQSTVAYKGGDAHSYVSIFDTATGEMDSQIEMCQEEVRQGYGASVYLGFSSPAEFVVSCYGEISDSFEIVNLETGDIRKVSQRPASLTDYGTVESSFKAVQRDP